MSGASRNVQRVSFFSLRCGFVGRLDPRLDVLPQQLLGLDSFRPHVLAAARKGVGREACTNRVAAGSAIRFEVPLGQRSRRNLASLVFNRNVRAECGKRDGYGREVCKVRDGSDDVCLEQIRAGYA
jgi:hypothetical protein